MSALPVWKLALVIAAVTGAALLLRRLVVLPHVLSLPVARRAERLGQCDFVLFAGAGVLMALANTVINGVPLLSSGGKLVLGMVALGVFVSIDLALECERRSIRLAGITEPERLPPRRFSSLTRKFFAVATVVTVLFSLIVILAVFRDLWWFTEAGLNEGSLRFVKRSILIDLSFIMGMLLVLVINLALSYSRNLRLLFDNQTQVLVRVSNGDMSGHVPVATRDEFGFIAGHTNLMIDGLRDRLRLMEGLAVAREVQETLLPSGVPHAAAQPSADGSGRLDVAGRCLYSDETGGDYYDFLENWLTEEDDTPRTGIIVGDVTGHGVGAALLMASVRAFVRMRAATPCSPAALLRDVNRQVVRDSYGTGRFVTMFLLCIEPVTHSISWAAAGHEPALVYRAADDSFTSLQAAGLPLGTMPGTVYETSCCRRLRQGDVVLLYTDGLVEARNRKGEMFGRDRVRRVMRTHAAKDAAGLLEAMGGVVRRFKDGAPQEDDITMVAVRVL